MRILLTGKDGQVGFELARALAPLGDIRALGRAACDLADQAALERVLDEIRPDLIVNPGAYTAVDRAESERDQAFAVNQAAPALLAGYAARTGALLVHYSTDYVFDGARDGAYREDDAPNPLGVYGASKLAGERAIRDAGCRHLIFRTSWVAGAHGANFAKTMLRLAAERDGLSVVADQTGAPTSAALVADITAQIAGRWMREDRDAFAYGLYHLAASGETTWHGYARHVIGRALAAGRALKTTPEAIRPIATADYPTPARRPANSRLDCTRLARAFGLVLPPWQNGIDHLLQQIL